MVPNVVSVKQTGPYRLLVRFNDGAQGELDVKAEISFEGVFEPLNDPDFFAQVRVDEELGTIVWPNGADLDPWVLHSRVTGIPIVFHGEESCGEDDCGGTEELAPQHGGSSTTEISRFLGIVVDMSCDEHASPHFHARYGDGTAVVEVPNLRLVRSTLPPRAVGFLMEWASRHPEELIQDWELARSGKPLKRIPPLE